MGYILIRPRDPKKPWVSGASVSLSRGLIR